MTVAWEEDEAYGGGRGEEVELLWGMQNRHGYMMAGHSTAGPPRLHGDALQAVSLYGSMVASLQAMSLHSSMEAGMKSPACA